MVESGKFTRNDQQIFNMPQWKYGFSTAIMLDENNKRVSHYITKYLSKDFRKIFGNFYYAGGSIIREPPSRLLNIDYDLIQSKEYRNEYLCFKYLEFDDISTMERFITEHSYTTEDISMTKEQKELAETIARANGGQAMFNLTKAARITGRCRTTFPAWLHAHGIMIEKSGKDKRVHINDLAIAMTQDRKSPVNSDS